MQIDTPQVNYSLLMYIYNLLKPLNELTQCIQNMTLRFLYLFYWFYLTCIGPGHSKKNTHIII